MLCGSKPNGGFVSSEVSRTKERESARFRVAKVALPGQGRASGADTIERGEPGIRRNFDRSECPVRIIGITVAGRFGVKSPESPTDRLSERVVKAS
jgi:hypothetical protein